MENKEICIVNGQRLSDVYPEIESNTILCKFLTGIGATHLELTSKRNSILIEPNVPPIKSKCSNPEYKDCNLFGVYQKVRVDDIIDYLENTAENHSFIKIVTTPESFSKVKIAFEECHIDIYNACFLLLDECHKFIQDVDYRADIILPIDDFFKFKLKAFVSATPIIPSDPRFDEQNFSMVTIIPNYLIGKRADLAPNIKGTIWEERYKGVRYFPSDQKTSPENHEKSTVSVVPTNNVLIALKRWLEMLKKNSEDGIKPFVFFINSATLIYQIIEKLQIKDESVVFCADKSVKKFQELGFNNAFEDWSEKEVKPYMFFTSRFYNAIDIELKIRPNIFFISLPFFSDYTLVDPFTDVKQAVGRFRNGVSKIIHIANFNKETLPDRSVEEIKTYVNSMAFAYNAIKVLYEDATDENAKRAFKAALDVLPFNKMLSNGRPDYFAIDNFIHEELVKSYYNNPSNLIARYGYAGCFTTWKEETIWVPYGDVDRISLKQEGKSKRQQRKEIVEQLVLIEKATIEDYYLTPLIWELESIDKYIVDAYFTIGKEKIEECKYMVKRINEAMILAKSTGVEVVKLVKNAFIVGKKYKLEYIKKELKRIYELNNITSDKRVTAQTIRQYFNVTETKKDGDRAFLIDTPLI